MTLSQFADGTAVAIARLVVVGVLELAIARSIVIAEAVLVPGA
jgi:hypothetical protein